MSKRAMQWVDTVKVANAPMMLVLRALAYQHSDKTQLYPSQARLAEKTGLSERGVRYALQLLSHFGVIKRTARSNGARGRTSDLVVLSFGLHDIGREQISTARTALRKPLSNRHRLPVVVDANSQPAPRAAPPGTACQGIGELIEDPSQGRTELSVEHCSTCEARADRPALRLLAGGRS